KTKEEALKWIEDKKRGLDTARAVQGGWERSQEAGHLINPGMPHPGSRAVGMAHRLDLMDPLATSRHQLELGRRLGGEWDQEKLPRTAARDYHRFLSQGGAGESGQAAMIGSFNKMAEKPMKQLYYYWRNPDLAMKIGLSEQELD